MYIDRFIWASIIVEKLASKHGVAPVEVESVFWNQPRFRFHEKGRVRGEDMYTALGQTTAGRYLIVFVLLKPGNTAMILSAREMTDAERRRFERK